MERTRPEMCLTNNCPKCGSRRVAKYQTDCTWQCWDCGKIWDEQRKPTGF